MKMNEQGKPLRKMTTLPRLLMAGLVAGSIMACAPVIDQRGYVFQDDIADRIQIGQTSYQQTKDLLGTPTTSSTLNGGATYYINSRFVTESYRAPKEVDRKVLAIYFNDDQVVRDMAIYGLEDGIIIPIVARTTETQGQELSIIGQIFSNLGRFGEGGSSADGI